jgi:hypothetical protein
MEWENGLDVVNAMVPAFRENLGPAELVPETYKKYWQKALYHDPATTRRIDLIRLEAGYADLTDAYHDSVEECLFIEGDCRLTGEGDFAGGDYFWRPPGWIHSASTRDGFLALLSLEGRSEESGPASRNIRPAELAGTNGIYSPEQHDAAIGPRGWIRRLETHLVAWQPGAAFARTEDDLSAFDLEHFSAKVLSRNPVSGAQSLLLRLHPGFRAPAGSFAADQQLFVLVGALTVGDQVLDNGCYFYRPGGSFEGPVASDSGAMLFFKSDGRLSYRTG